MTKSIRADANQKHLDIGLQEENIQKTNNYPADAYEFFSKGVQNWDKPTANKPMKIHNDWDFCDIYVPKRKTAGEENIAPHNVFYNIMLKLTFNFRGYCGLEIYFRSGREFCILEQLKRTNQGGEEHYRPIQQILAGFYKR
jgi:hypothetical protein